MIGLFFGKKH